MDYLEANVKWDFEYADILQPAQCSARRNKSEISARSVQSAISVKYCLQWFRDVLNGATQTRATLYDLC